MKIIEGLLNIPDDGVGLHEICKVEGGGYSYTEQPALFASSKKEMLELLKLIAVDVEKYPVLDWEKLHE